MHPARLRRPVICLLGAVVLALAASAAQAATRTVDNLYDDGPGSFRDAVRQSASGDTIVFAVAGTVPLSSGEIVINRDLNIQGPTETKVAVEASRTRVFHIVGAKLNISNLSVSGSILAQSGSGGGRGGDSEGGAILNNGTLTMTDSVVWGTFAAGGQGGSAAGGDGGNARGGAVANFGSMTLLRCTLYGNSAVGGDGGYGNQGKGGAGGNGLGGNIYNAGSLTMINSTINGGNAVGGAGGESQAIGGAGGFGQGGGIYNAGTFSFTNCTIASNRAAGGSGSAGGPSGYGAGGGMFQADASGISTPRNVIIALNNVSFGIGNSYGPDAAGYFASQGHNLIGRTDGSGGWASGDRLGGTTEAERLDPEIGFLQHNGGPTMTRLPRPTSPAVDGGDDGALVPPVNPIDQRGFPRKIGRQVDIGAVEVGGVQSGPGFTVTTTGEHDDGACTTDDCTLLEAMNRVNASPDANTINFAPGVTGSISTQMTPQGLYINSPLTITGPGATNLSLTALDEGRILYVAAPHVVISGLGLRNGRVYIDDGAAIKNVGNLTLIDCSLFYNNAGSPPGGGGGIFNSNGATLTLIRCAFESNITDRSGGAVYSEGNFSATNCTFANNYAANGGAIMSRATSGGSGMTLRNCTITSNTTLSGGTGTGDGGGGVLVEGSAQQNHVGNTIIAGNNSFTFPATNPDVGGSYTSDGHNFIGNSGYSIGFTDGLSGDQVGTLVQPKDAMLARITNNGGSTNTAALLPGSPAINRGDDRLAMSSDQRGYARNGVSDIGAFEFNGLPAQVTLVAAASRKLHSTAGYHDRPLPLDGTRAIESRTGGASGNHTVVFRFLEPLRNVGNVRFEGASGRVSTSSIGADAHEYVVDLAGVGNAQTITVTLEDITDAAGNTARAVSASMSVLLADANGDGSVNSGDAQQTRARTGAAANAETYRFDFNGDGIINSGDAAIARTQSGNFLP